MDRRQRFEWFNVISVVRYHVAVGTRAVFTEDEQRAIRKELGLIMERRQVPQDHQAAALGYIQAEELCTGKGDGAVTVTSAMLDGVTTVRRFEVAHAQLRSLSGEPLEADQVFQWILSCLKGSGSPQRPHISAKPTRPAG